MTVLYRDYFAEKKETPQKTPKSLKKSASKQPKKTTPSPPKKEKTKKTPKTQTNKKAHKPPHLWEIKWKHQVSLRIPHAHSYPHAEVLGCLSADSDKHCCWSITERFRVKQECPWQCLPSMKCFFSPKYCSDCFSLSLNYNSCGLCGGTNGVKIQD